MAAQSSREQEARKGFDQLANALRATEANAYWREALERAGQRLDAARVAMDDACSPGRALPHEDKFGQLETNLAQARKFYRAALEMLTGQSAEAIERRATA